MDFLKMKMQIDTNKETIEALKKIIDMQYSDPVNYKGEYKPTRFEKWQTKQMNKDYLLHKEWAVPQINELKEFLREYFKYRKDWAEEIMKRSPWGSPLDTWMMISLHKLSKDMLEKLDSKKEYIASLNDPKAFEAINLGVLKRERKTEKKSKFVEKPDFLLKITGKLEIDFNDKMKTIKNFEIEAKDLKVLIKKLLDEITGVSLGKLQETLQFIIEKGSEM